MPPTLFQAAARASYWFLVDCGPGLYSEPEFGPIAAKMTGDSDAEAAPVDVDPELAVDAALAEAGGAPDDELLEQAAAASVVTAARTATPAYLYLVFLVMPHIPFHCTVMVWLIRSPLARRASAAPGPDRPGVSLVRRARSTGASRRR